MIDRRKFLSSLLSTSVATAAALKAGASRVERLAPRILLRSAWQSVNIGDIGHTPGAIEVIRRILPKSEVVLWPSSKGLEPEVRQFLARSFRNLSFAEGTVIEGRPSTEALQRAFQDCDMLLHSSGSGFPARADVGHWSRITKKPYGILPISLDPVSGFGANRSAEGGTLEFLRVESLSQRHPLDEATRKVIDDAEFMYCRDSITEAYLRSQGVKPGKLAFGPDTQFGMTLTDDSYGDQFCAENGLTAGRFICVIPRLRYTPHTTDARFDDQKAEINQRAVNADMGKLREVICEYVEKTSGRVLICPEMTYEIELGKKELYDRLPVGLRSHVVWQSHFWLPNQAAAVYARSRAVISLECHSPIIALIHSVPTLYLRQPTDTCKGEMYPDLGLKDCIREIDEVDGAQIWDWLHAALASPARSRARAVATMRRVVQYQNDIGQTLSETFH